MLVGSNFWKHPAQPQEQVGQDTVRPVNSSATCILRASMDGSSAASLGSLLHHWSDEECAAGDGPGSRAWCVLCHQRAACATARVEVGITPRRDFTPLL